MTAPHLEERRDAPFDPRLARRLLAFLRPYRGRVALALAMLLGVGAIEAVQPILVKVAIDRHIAVGDLAGLAGIATLYLATLVGELALGYGRTYLTEWVGQRSMHDLRQRLFDHLQRLPLAFFDKNPVGRLVTRVTSDVEVLNDLFSSGVVAILSDAFMLAAVAVTMLVLDWRLALVTFAVLPCVFGVSFWFRTRMRDAYREIRRWVARLNAYLQERVTGLVVVQLFRREAASREEYGAINRGHQSAQLESVRWYALFYPLVELLSSVAVALVLWYAGAGIARGALTFGTLVAFLQYAQKFFSPIRDLAEKYNLLQAAMASGERLFGLLDEPPAPGMDRPALVADLAPRGSIAFENVWFRYTPERWILRDVSFEVPAGSRLALVGPTGSGKTTIASLVCRFYDAQQGRVLVDGHDVREWPPRELRRRVGLVLQDVFLFSGSVLDNVSLGEPRIDADRARSALAAIGAARFVDALPRGLDTAVGERGRTLSTGQKQLLAFGRALAWDPPILILDEATSSVDSESEALIEAAVERLMADRTALVIAHRLSTIRRVDSILVLHHGEVRERGTHDELLSRGGLYARLWELQFAGGDEAAVTVEERS